MIFPPPCQGSHRHERKFVYITSPSFSSRSTPFTHTSTLHTNNCTQGSHRHEREFVYVDPHVLCTPAIGDIDGDGHEELVRVLPFSV